MPSPLLGATAMTPGVAHARERRQRRGVSSSALHRRRVDAYQGGTGRRQCRGTLGSATDPTTVGTDAMDGVAAVRSALAADPAPRVLPSTGWLPSAASPLLDPSPRSGRASAAVGRHPA
ncbi:MAG: hypothetical protein ACRCXL_03750 [Dermatophilaceae bacterium]